MIDEIINDVVNKYEGRNERLIHIEGVVRKALELGTKLNLDLEKLEIAAWYHDYTKYDDIEVQIAVLTEEQIEAFKDTPIVFHALSAAEYLKIRHHITDDDILNAIRFHVFGNPDMNIYAKVILLADKIEDSRNYFMVEHFRKLAETSIDDAILNYLLDLKEMLKKDNKTIHPWMNELINKLGE